MKYKLNVARDVDTDESGVYIMNTIAGWRFDYDQLDYNHVWAFDSMKELREAVRNYVIPCECPECLEELSK
jgi:hypothetical protein